MAMSMIGDGGDILESAGHDLQGLGVVVDQNESAIQFQTNLAESSTAGEKVEHQVAYIR